MEASADREPLRVALLGCGAVGSQVFRLLSEQAGDLAMRVGAPLQVAGVAVRILAGGRAPPGCRPSWSRPTPCAW